MKKSLRLLLVEDVEDDAQLLLLELSNGGIEPDYLRVDTAQDLEAALDSGRWDAVFADYNLPSFTGLDALRIVQAKGLDIPFILVSGAIGEEQAVEALMVGAHDFILKGQYARLVSALERALKDAVLRRERRQTAEELAQHREHLEELVQQRTEELAAANEELHAQSEELQLQREELQQANELLERKVEQRTADLTRSVEALLQMLEELREKDSMLLQQTRQAALGEMIGNIAHQWRQPLNTLGLIIQQGPLFYALGQFDKEFLDTSTKKSMELIKHMSGTIDDFRNFFRPDKEKAEFKVATAIASALSLVNDSFKNQEISIEVVTNADPVIFGYRNEYAQVLLNILNNARDVLMEREIGDPRVTITILNEGGRAVVTVADNAGGIPEEIISKIFDPYFTTKGPQAGTGVGLFMSRTIIEKNMSGRLSARNIAGGAEFRIEV